MYLFPNGKEGKKKKGRFEIPSHRIPSTGMPMQGAQKHVCRPGTAFHTCQPRLQSSIIIRRARLAPSVGWKRK